MSNKLAINNPLLRNRQNTATPLFRFKDVVPAVNLLSNYFNSFLFFLIRGFHSLILILKTIRKILEMRPPPPFSFSKKKNNERKAKTEKQNNSMSFGSYLPMLQGSREHGNLSSPCYTPRGEADSFKEKTLSQEGDIAIPTSQEKVFTLFGTFLAVTPMSNALRLA